MKKSSVEILDSEWKTLYKVGGVAPLITLAFYLSEMFIMIFGEPYPTTTEDWFLLFQRSKLLGLFYLNAPDIFSIALLGVMFLALYIALRRVNASCMAIAALFALIGVVVFIVPRVATLSAASLSDQYAAAATEAQRGQILAAGEALNALGVPTPQTTGFLFMAVAVLIISVVMLRSEYFGKATAIVGILASLLTFADDTSLVLAPSLAGMLMPISGVVWILWWLLISRGLFRLGKAAS